MVNEEADCGSGALEALACPQLSSFATGEGFLLGKDLARHSLLIGALDFPCEMLYNKRFSTVKRL